MIGRWNRFLFLIDASFDKWFLTFINGGTPVLYWFAFLKPEIDGHAGATTIEKLYNNFFWFDLSIPFIIWCHAGLYGIPALIGFLTWFGVEFMDNAYEFWMNIMINYCGGIVHFIGSLFLLVGAGFWTPNGIITRQRAWITSWSYFGWSVISFVWIALTVD